MKRNNKTQDQQCQEQRSKETVKEMKRISRDIEKKRNFDKQNPKKYLFEWKSKPWGQTNLPWKRFYLGAWTYNGYERKSISLPLLVAEETEMKCRWKKETEMKCR